MSAKKAAAFWHAARLFSGAVPELFLFLSSGIWLLFQMKGGSVWCLYANGCGTESRWCIMPRAVAVTGCHARQASDPSEPESLRVYLI